MTTLVLDLVTGKTPVIQFYVRGVDDAFGSSVGSPIAGVTDVTDTWIYTFILPGELATGDYWVQLTGVSNPNGSPFPVRDGIAYPGIPWSIIDATIAAPPIIAPPDVANACRVQLRARRGANAILARVLITCGSTGRLADSAFADVAFDGQTDVNGLLQVDLPWSSVSGVGRYRFKLIDSETGDVFHDRTVTVPDQPTALYEELQ